MALGHINDLFGSKVDNPEAKSAVMKVLIGPDQGWGDHVMRVFEIEAGGFTPRHAHAWPHINYVLEGEGLLFLNGKENPISAGSYAYVPGGEMHQFQNTGNQSLKFICIVTLDGHK